MPTDDYIKRSEAVARLTGKACCVNSPGKVRAFATAINVIETMPSADVEPVRHGHNVKWDYPTLFECSLCGWECFDTVPGDTDTYQYCPNCGAKMEGEADDAEIH